MARKPQPTSNRPQPVALGQNRWPLALLVLVVLMVFSQVCGHELLGYDDIQNITQNDLVIKLTPANLLHFWKQPFAGMYIPLTYNFWSIQAKLASFLPAGQATALNPYLFHTVNLFFHLTNACLVFFIIRRFVKNDWATLLGALLFAIHPVQVEPVAWVTGFKDMLSGFFSLLSLGLYLDYAQAPSTGRWRKASYLLALGFFLAALLAKPGVVVMPLVAGLIGLVLLHKNIKQLVFDLAPWVVLVLPIAIVTKMAQPVASHGFLPTFGQRLLISGDSLSFYLLKLIAPLHLGYDYGRTPQLVLQHDWLYLTGLIPYLLAIAITWKAKAPYRAAAGIFVLLLLPVSGILPFTFQLISTVADRYLYLAMLGPALAASWFIDQSKTKTVWVIALTILALFGIKSMTQAPTWEDSLTLNQQAININPQSWTAYGNLANAKAEQNQQEEAITLYQKALALKPDDEKSTFNLGVAYGLINQTEAAIAAYRKTVALIKANNDTDNPFKAELLRDAYVNLGVLYDKSKRTDEAIASYRNVIAVDPGFTFSYANLGNLYAEIGRKDDAIAMYQKALALDPFIRGIDSNLGELLAEQGDLADAVTHFNKALAQTPDDPPTRLNLGLALYHQKEFAEASRQFLQVIKADRASTGASVEAYNGLGAVYMAQGRWQEASDALRTALQYAPDHQYAKDNLLKTLDEIKKANDADGGRSPQ